MHRVFVSIAVGCLLLACGSMPSGPDPVAAAIASPHRSTENRARDPFRHPSETLAFFGFEADMTVVEILPGGGWYTEILSPALVAGGGRLIAANYGPESEVEYRQRNYHAMVKRFQAAPALYGSSEIVLFEPPDALDLAPPGSVDMVLTFRNTHNWISTEVQAEVYAAFHRALKPGGTLGVVQHRASAGADPIESASRGYVPQAYMVEMVEAAGFELVGTSEVNANPRDTKDHPDGVWDLPPVFMAKDVKRAHYASIGESDRMTLRFVKR